jgi:hypothetical protein
VYVDVAVSCLILCADSNPYKASSADGKDGGLEFVKPPAESQPGERIYFEGEKYESESWYHHTHGPLVSSFDAGSIDLSLVRPNPGNSVEPEEEDL